MDNTAGDAPTEPEGVGYFSMPPPMPVEPPPLPPSQEPKEKPAWLRKLGPLGTALAFLAAKAKTFLTLLWAGVKFLKIGKVLLTSGSMLLSVWLYSLLFGWPFAVGFVVLIFIHEMGHVFVAWRQGLPISAPIFIPMMGALILSKRSGKSAYEAAIMGIGGPIGGTLGSLACWAIYSMTGAPIFMGLAFVGFLLNLFNLTPVYPLDGGWIVGAISPWLWLVGLVAMAGMFLTGFVHNPMIIILVIMGVPRVWTALKGGSADVLYGVATTKIQKWTMGLAYVGLAGFLMWCMAETDFKKMPARHRQPRGQMARSDSPIEIRSLG